jgi:Rrf2 family protein
LRFGLPETNRDEIMLAKTAEYALRAVACLAGEQGERLAADAICARTKVPRRYLHKVLQDLIHAGIVHSQSGPGGGYSLSQPVDDISILTIVNAVSPLERIRHCPLGLKSHTKLCPLHAALDQAYARTETAFAGITMGELLRSGSSVIPLCESVG